MLNMNTLVSLKAQTANRIAELEAYRLDLKRDRKELLREYHGGDDEYKKSDEGLEMDGLIDEATIELAHIDKKLVKTRRNQKALLDEIHAQRKIENEATAQARGWHFKQYLKSVGVRVKFFIYPANNPEASVATLIYELDDGSTRRSHSFQQITQGNTEFYNELKFVLRSKGYSI